MFKVIVVVGVVALLAALVWVGGEMHYRNCVDAAKASPPTTVTTGSGLFEDESRVSDRAALEDEIDACSRTPF